MLVITQHAHQRFLERFPDVPVFLTERVDAAIPFGGQQGSSEMRLDPDYDVVFVVNRDNVTGDLLLVTILTKDQALANLSLNTDLHCKQHCLIDPRPACVQHETTTKPQNAEKIEKINALRDRAKIDIEAFGYVYPELSETKQLTKKISAEQNCSKSMVDKYYWKEFGRLMYEYNAKYRSVIKDAE